MPSSLQEHYTNDAHGTVFGMDETGKADSALPTDSDREPKPALEFSSQASYAQQMIAIPANVSIRFPYR